MKPVYALEGGAFLCGAAVDWVRDSLGIIKKSSDIESLAASVASSDGVDFVPALTGLGAPHWDANARGTITGLTRGSGAAHIARATLDAIALQNADILRVMESESGRRLSDLRVDGGACVNNLLMQIQSDVLGRTLIRPTQTETTGAGASYLAGLGCGTWSDESELASIWAIDERFAPVLRKPQREQRVMQWQRALKQTQAY
jgi:glycerol kinase